MTMQEVEGECRLKYETIKNSKKNIEFCSNCCHYAEISLDSDCLCCGQKIKRMTNNPEIKKLQYVVHHLESILDNWQDPKDLNCVPSVRIKLGTFYYHVDMRYLKEFQHTSDKYHAIFLAKLKKNCPKTSTLSII